MTESVSDVCVTETVSELGSMCVCRECVWCGREGWRMIERECVCRVATGTGSYSEELVCVCDKEGL